MNDKKRLKAAIIGCGIVAPAHAESYLKIPDMEISALCDIVPEKSAALAQRLGISPLIDSDYRKVLSIPNLDLVSVCTDHASHSDICACALENGISVLCEKPLSSNSLGLDAILSARKRFPSPLFVPVFQNRFNPVFRALKTIVSSGALGIPLTGGVICNCLRRKEYYESDAWRGTWKWEGGSVMINQAIHYLDLLLWIFGRPKSVSANFANIARKGTIETEDCVSASLELESSALCSVCVTSSSVVEWENNIWFGGTEGYVLVLDGKIHKALFSDSSIPAEIDKLIFKFSQDDSVSVGKSHYGNLHFVQISDFVSALRSGTPPFISLESAAETMKTVFAIYESGSSGRRIGI